ncbi:hypothetical protein NKH18_13930 [Streptomyces sp. M10(2022)]
MTTEDVEIGTQEVHLHLGNAPVHPPEPVAQLAHLTHLATQLTQRLNQLGNQLGNQPNQAHSAALSQLATEIPAAILARTGASTPTSLWSGNISPRGLGHLRSQGRTPHFTATTAGP